MTQKIFSLTIAAVLMFSCGQQEQDLDSVIASNDLEQIREYRSTVKTEEMALAEKLAKLDEAINELDSLEKLPLITVQSLASQPFDHFIELQGDVQTKNNLVLYPEYAGVLQNVLVKEGQQVSKGQVLARIDDGGLGQQRAQMQLQADLAKTTFEKQARLWEQKIGSEIQYLQAKTSYESQEEALSQMDRQLAKTTIRAPFSGVIDEVITDQGSVVSPGMNPVMRIVGLRDMYIEMDVPEAHLITIRKGKLAIVGFPVLGKEIESKVRSVGNYINPDNRTFKVEIALPEQSDIKPNLNAKVKLNDYSQEKAILIMQSIISEDSDGKEYVYVIRDREGDKGVAQRVYIEPGLTQGDFVEVRSGLKDEDQIVVEGARAIRDGQRVQILAPNS